MKGLLALVLLGLLVLGAGSLLAVSPRARVRWYAWRMRSSDPAAAAGARLKLFELDRPAIDDVLPELVARELAARMPLGGRVAVTAVGSWTYSPGIEDPSPSGVVAKDPTAQLLAKRLRSRALVTVSADRGFGWTDPSLIAIPLDDDLAPKILAAVRAELGARAP